MSDAINRAFLAGLGAFSMTRDKVEKLIDELVKQGEIAKGEQKSFINNIQEEIEKRQADVKTFIKTETEKILKKMDIPSRAEVDALKAEIAKLKKKAK